MRWQGILGLLLMALWGVACGSDTEEVNDGAVCGEATCGPNQYCCDSSCGLCIEAQVACEFTCDDTTS